jgi:hypothetical protein
MISLSAYLPTYFYPFFPLLFHIFSFILSLSSHFLSLSLSLSLKYAHTHTDPSTHFILLLKGTLQNHYRLIYQCLFWMCSLKHFAYFFWNLPCYHLFKGPTNHFFLVTLIFSSSLFNRKWTEYKSSITPLEKVYQGTGNRWSWGTWKMRRWRTSQSIMCMGVLSINKD